jgi:hypothetical protein
MFIHVVSKSRVCGEGVGIEQGTAELVQMDVSAYLGYGFPLRPTPRPTQSPIIPVKSDATETPQAQEPPTPMPAATVTDAAGRWDIADETPPGVPAEKLLIYEITLIGPKDA